MHAEDANVLRLLSPKGREAMHIAAEHNKAKMIDLLCELGAEASLDHRDNSGYTPAFLAADRNSTDALQKIFDHRPDTGSITVNSLTLAHVAARRGHVDTLRLLKRNRVALSVRDDMQKTPAHWAARQGHDNVLKLLAEIEGLPSLDVTDVNLTTPAHEAARYGYVSTLQTLEFFTGTLNVMDRDNRTPAHSAALGGHTDVLRKLHKSGVPVDTQDRDGLSPLLFAAGKGHVNMLRMLIAELKASAQTCDNNGRSAAHWAAMNNHAGILEELKRVDGVLQIRTPEGRLPVHDAAAFGSEEALRALHRLGQPLFAPTRRGVTAVHEAAKNGRNGILMFLGEIAKEDVTRYFNARTSAGDPTFERSPAHYAAIMGHDAILYTLNALGAMLTDKDENSMTVAHLAAVNNRVGVLQALAHMNARTTLFETIGGPNSRMPVSYAAELGHEDVVRVLDKLGAQGTFAICDFYAGNTPAHFAAKNAKVGVLRALFDTAITSRRSAAILESFSSRNRENNTPASAAVLNNDLRWSSRQRTVEFLAAAGANLFSNDGILLDHIEGARPFLQTDHDQEEASTLIEHLKLAGEEDDPMVRQVYAAFLIGGRFPDVIRSALRANFYDAAPFFRIAFHKFKKIPSALRMLQRSPDDTTKGPSIDAFLQEFSKFNTIYPAPPLLQFYSQNSQDVILFLQHHCDKKRQEKLEKIAKEQGLEYEAPDDGFNKLPVELLTLILKLAYRPADAYRPSVHRRDVRAVTPILRTSFSHLIV